MFIPLKQTFSKCWICGSTADSHEHKFKKSDITKIYGNGDHTKNSNNQPIHIQDLETKISGPNSKKLTFNKVICQKCNNGLSQPFDKAYEKFSNYVSENIHEIYENKKIDFKKIYGDSWSSDSQNLYKYFIKVFGCYISSANVEISEKVNDYIHSKTDVLQHMKFKFYLKPDIMHLQTSFNNQYHHLYYGATKWIGNSESEIESIWGWFTNYGLTIYWIYNLSIESNNKYNTQKFEDNLNIDYQMSEHLPKSSNIRELIESLENESFDKKQLVYELLNS